MWDIERPPVPPGLRSRGEAHPIISSCNMATFMDDITSPHPSLSNVANDPLAFNYLEGNTRLLAGPTLEPLASFPSLSLGTFTAGPRHPPVPAVTGLVIVRRCSHYKYKYAWFPPQVLLFSLFLNYLDPSCQNVDPSLFHFLLHFSPYTTARHTESPLCTRGRLSEQRKPDFPPSSALHPSFLFFHGTTIFQSWRQLIVSVTGFITLSSSVQIPRWMNTSPRCKSCEERDPAQTTAIQWMRFNLTTQHPPKCGSH